MNIYDKYLEDQRNDTLGGGLGYKYLPKLVELLPTFNFSLSKVLDIGPGPFETWEWFNDNYNNKIHGVDIGKCVEDISKTWSKEKQECMNCPIDAHFLPDSYKEYDLIISFHAFEHMIDLPKVLNNIYNALKPGGYIYYSLPIPSYNWNKGHWYDVPSVDVMNKLLINSNFKVMHSQLISDFRYRPEQEMIGLGRK